MNNSIKIAWNLKKNCENCVFYVRLDSGYGYCRRFPPVSTISYLNFSWKKLKFVPIYEFEYQIVVWSTPPCGEYKEKINGKTER